MKSLCRERDIIKSQFLPTTLVASVEDKLEEARVPPKKYRAVIVVLRKEEGGFS